MDTKLIAALLACLLLGMRHGFDYDHLAAIADITAVQRNWKSGMRLGVTYALGHAFTVVALGVMVLVLHLGLPERLDHWTEKLIGLTLILLGIGVVVGLLRRRPHKHQHVHDASVHTHLHAHELPAASEHSHTNVHVESRIAAAVNLFLWFGWWIRRFFDPQLAAPKQFRWNYSGRSVFVIGVIHGVGAETPSQLALFFIAANLGGTMHGLLGLGAFALGLVAMNTLMTATLGGAFGTSGKRPVFYKLIGWTGAVYSLAIGVIFLFGLTNLLPQLGN
jgi:high-affinity nickel-transport protein